MYFGALNVINIRCATESMKQIEAVTSEHWMSCVHQFYFILRFYMAFDNVAVVGGFANGRKGTTPACGGTALTKRALLRAENAILSLFGAVIIWVFVGLPAPLLAKLSARV